MDSTRQVGMRQVTVNPEAQQDGLGCCASIWNRFVAFVFSCCPRIVVILTIEARVPRQTLNDRVVVPEPDRQRIQQPRIDRGLGVDNRQHANSARTTRNMSRAENDYPDFVYKLQHYGIKIPDQQRLAVLTNNNPDILNDEHRMNGIVLYLAYQTRTTGLPDELCCRAVEQGMLDAVQLEAVRRGEDLNKGIMKVVNYAEIVKGKMSCLVSQSDDEPTVGLQRDGAHSSDSHHGSISDDIPSMPREPASK
ncbi:hypothetical protein [Kistimonas asteriae]|uniref:hypothetical protein n=1 Tax=Kistimonas asteriae TaxID=517724 RepID=UPI001BA68C43|nr:hypothetical protein [Kistimonas asteriae]